MNSQINLSCNSKLVLTLYGLYFVIAMLILTANPIEAFAQDGQREARKLSKSGQILPLEKIHEKANLIKPGKILETEFENKKGRYIYEVELLDNNGLVWEVELDAKTGALIKLEED
jgi:uncharacterized membrane protein YkoI